MARNADPPRASSHKRKQQRPPTGKSFASLSELPRSHWQLSREEQEETVKPQEFSHSILQYPCECYPFIKLFHIFVGSCGFRRLILHIVKVFFRKSFIENVEVFLSEGWHGTTLTSCRFMRIGAFCALIPHICYGVGYCVVYFPVRSFHNLH